MGRNKKSLYKNRWVWVIGVLVVIGGGYGGYALASHNSETSNGKQEVTTQKKDKTDKTDKHRNIAKKTENKVKQHVNASNLSKVDKETLALLGLPEGFVSDYGDLNTDTILTGQSNVTSNAVNTTQSDEKVASVAFSGIVIESDGPKNIVKLNNVQSNVDNLSYIQGYFVIDGDTITYKNQGTRVSGAEQDANAQELGTQSLDDLYNKYKNNSNFKKVKKLITDKTIDSIKEDSDNAASKTVVKDSGMNIEQMKQGDFSSIAGTWKKSDGETVSIDSNGTVSMSGVPVTEKIDTTNATVMGNATQFGLHSGADSSMGGGEMALMVPANTVVEGLTTRSEDAILIGQNTMDELVYTRVR